MPADRVLVVDDDATIRSLLKRVCQEDGYTVLLAETAQEALETIQTQQLDVAVIDLRLPDQSGLNVLKALKEAQHASEAIVLTGYSDLETAAESLRLGAYDYLQKDPFSLRLVPLMVGRALERRRLTKHNEQLIADLRAANRKLEEERQRVLQAIHHLGQALSNSMEREQLADTFVQALLDLSASAGAALLVLPNERHEALLTLVSRQPLTEAAREALIDRMLEHVSPKATLSRQEIRVSVEAPVTEERPIDTWTHFRLRSLESRQTIYGIAALGYIGNDQPDETTRTVFHILATQGAIALQNAYLFERMRQLATHDSLTGLYNHGHFFELLDAELSRSRRQGHHLAVIMLDLDRGEQGGLKYVNDQFGHQSGDALLQAVGERLRENVRVTDIIARYGGDEFCILAPETNQQEGLSLAERLRRRLSESPFQLACCQISITASIGVSVYSGSECEKEITANALVRLADQACYEAKDAGGDTVRIAFERSL